MPKSNQEMILGIDPGLATTGYGIITFQHHQARLVEAGVITTERHLDIEQRLQIIYQQIIKLIKQYRPTRVAIEQLFFCKNVKTALAVGQARGVILLACSQTRSPLIEMTPLQVKLAVSGYGQASKLQVQKMVKALLKLKTAPRSDDLADALAIAYCAAQMKQLRSKRS